MISIDDQLAALSRRTERIVPEADLRAKLERSAKTGIPLRIKLGMDPTAPDVTLGHAVPLRVVRQFQDWGHKAVLIIGDYTARVGDPSGRNKTRPQLSGEEIDANAQTYVAQVGKILLTDPAHLETRYNGEWFAKMNLLDILRLTSKKSVAQMLEREDFKNRYTTGVDIRIHEFLYPLMQGWDSVMIDADVEMGGSDQLFNNLVGRDLMADEGKSGQAVIVTPLLVGTDGVKKMSKSQKNYIAVTDPPSGPDGMFGKIMSLPDSLMESYYTLLTDLPMGPVCESIQKRPRDAKITLAKHVITWLHSAQAAQAAQDEFNRIIVEKEVPVDIAEVKVLPGHQKLPPILVQAKLAASNSEAVRKIQEGAVRRDGEKVTNPNADHEFGAPSVIQLGNRKFVRVLSLSLDEIKQRQNIGFAMVEYAHRHLHRYSVAYVDLKDYSLASGTLIQIQEYLFIATAAHTVSELPNERFQVLSSAPKQLGGERVPFKDAKWSLSDAVDVGLLELHADSALNILRKEALPLNRVVDLIAGRQEFPSILTGYPSEHTSISKEKRTIVPKFMGVSESAVHADDWQKFLPLPETAPPPNSEIDVFLDYEQADHRRSDTHAPIKLPELGGMSGGGVWDLGFSSERLWSPEHSRIYAIQSRWDAKRVDSRYTRATQIIHWIALVAKHYPALRSPLMTQFPRLTSLKP